MHKEKHENPENKSLSYSYTPVIVRQSMKINVFENRWKEKQY